MGFVEQYGTHLCPLRMEVCHSVPLLSVKVWSDMIVDSWDLHVTSSCHRIKLYSVNRTRAATRKRLEELAARGEGIEPLSRPLEYTLEGHDEYLAARREHPREPLN